MPLATLHAKIYRTGEEPFTVEVLNPDMVAWDRYAHRHRLPNQQSAPLLWMTFVTWASAKRNKHIPADMPYEAWEATTEHIEPVDADGNPLADDEDAADPVDPTQPGLDLG